MSLLNKVWAVLGAIAMTLLALVGLRGWWTERKRSKRLAVTAAELATRNAEAAKREGEAKVNAARADAVGAVRDSHREAEGRINDPAGDTADYLRSNDND